MEKTDIITIWEHKSYIVSYLTSSTSLCIIIYVHSCKELTDARQELHLRMTPDVLILHIKRYRYYVHKPLQFKAGQYVFAKSGIDFESNAKEEVRSVFTDPLHRPARIDHFVPLIS